ncbi:MAG: hypothetical protein PHP44_14375, partial [Kiritimatiellae bacterium]|nr:hypothetical protein [Kiritimatiellia bacterium]
MAKKLMVLLIVLAVTGGALFSWLYLQHWRTMQQAENQHQEIVAAYEQITAFQQTNPDLREEIIRRYESFIETYPDAEEALLARAQIEQFQQTREQELQTAEQQFLQSIQRLLQADQLEEAAVATEQYDGPYANELKKVRDNTLRDIRKQIKERDQAETEKNRAAQAALDEVMKNSADALYHFQFSNAQAILAEAMNNPVLTPEISALQAFASSTEAVCAMPSQICYSFLENMDEPVSVSLKSGDKIVRINDVEETRILAGRVLYAGGNEVGTTPDPFTFQDLSLREMASRISKEKNDKNFTMVTLLFIQ